MRLGLGVRLRVRVGVGLGLGLEWVRVRVGCDVVCIVNHSRSVSITEYSLCTPKVIIVQKSYSSQHNRSACRTAAHDMLRAQLATCNYPLNPGLSIQSLS